MREQNLAYEESLRIDEAKVVVHCSLKVSFQACITISGS